MPPELCHYEICGVQSTRRGKSETHSRTLIWTRQPISEPARRPAFRITTSNRVATTISPLWPAHSRSPPTHARPGVRSTMWRTHFSQCGASNRAAPEKSVTCETAYWRAINPGRATHRRRLELHSASSLPDEVDTGAAAHCRLRPNRDIRRIGDSAPPVRRHVPLTLSSSQASDQALPNDSELVALTGTLIAVIAPASAAGQPAQGRRRL